MTSTAIRATSRTSALLLIVALGLGGCGRIGTLKHLPGQRPVPVASGASKPATPDQLITPNTQSRPGRNVDILVHSERRPDDKFDLPPGPENGRTK
ncbi:MAG TPA: hypothetical protein VF463_20200 [Sphingobium sp.]